MSDKRKRLLESALTLFVKQGFQGTPTSQVARHAGVATGTLFHHFENKSALIEGVYSDCKNNRDGMIDLVDQGQSIEQRFKNLFTGRIEWSLDNVEANTFLKRFENSEFSKEELVQNEDLVGLISEGRLSRKLRSVDEDILESSIDSLIDNFVSFYIEHPEKKKDPRHMYGSFDFFWTAIKY